MPRPRKRFAQHWLKDASVHRAIVAAAGFEGREGTKVLEIGPGTGQLTRRLLAAGAEVTAVELDRDLCNLLRKQFEDEARFHLVEADFLKTSLPEAIDLLVANIPYNITSPILEKVLGSPERPVEHFQRIVLLVQKEIALRLQAKPGSKAYGAMSVRAQYLADCQLVCDVPPSAFKPPPKVMSAVISLSPRRIQPPAADPHWFALLVRQGFATRRKMLRNVLRSLVDRDAVSEALESLG
ncbi:MAG: 16S rRNA (adenine(1518)-N(6)/adenine(1519)-N(6))-dimethyltransferase RsmA [Cyanobacteria bacterium J06639_1]